MGPKQASHTGKPLLGRDWSRHAEITDPEHHYRHMKMHEDLAERHRDLGNDEKAAHHEKWAKGHHALARNKLSHMEWRPDVEYSSIESGETTHRVGVTISDPGHSSVTQRGERHQRTFRTKASSPEHAIKKAHSHYKKQGYKVHDAWHIEHSSVVEVSTAIPVKDHDEAVHHLHSVTDKVDDHSSSEHQTHIGAVDRKKTGELHSKLVGSGFEHKNQPFGPRDSTKHLYTKGSTKVWVSQPHYTEQEYHPLTHHKVMVQTTAKKEHSSLTDVLKPSVSIKKDADGHPTLAKLSHGRSWIHHQGQPAHHHLKGVAWHAKKMAHHMREAVRHRGSEKGQHHQRKANHHHSWLQKHRQALKG